MGTAIALREEYDAETLRRLARRLAARAKDPNQARRLLSLAAIRGGKTRGGKTRGEAARIGGMDRQMLRDWVIAFNAQGPEGLINAKPPGRQPKLTTEHKATLKTLVEQGPQPERDGVVRWRCTDLQQGIKDRFAVEVDAVTVGRVLKALGFAHISARAQHPAQDPAAIAAFKKTSPSAWRRR